MYLHVSAYLLWAAIGLPTLSVGLPGLCVGEVGRPVHTGQLVDACTVQKVNVLCACMSHWVGNDFQQQQQWQQLQQQATTTQRGLLAGLSKLCIRMCQTCWRSTKHAYAMLCHEHDSYDPQRDTQNYPVYIYTHTHTHTQLLLPFCPMFACVFAAYFQGYIRNSNSKRDFLWHPRVVGIYSLSPCKP